MFIKKLSEEEITYSKNCISLKEYSEWKCLDPKVLQTSDGKTISSSTCAVCNSKRSRFIKEQEASGLWGSKRLKLLWVKYHN